MAASLSEKIPPIRPYRISLIPQGFHGVHAAGAQGWDIPGGTGDGRQGQSREAKRRGIRRRDAIKLSLHTAT